MLWLVAVIALGAVWIVVGAATVAATIRAKTPQDLTGTDWPPVTILKPLKGIDPDLRDRLQAFLELDYPDYEVIFCIAQSTDPALAVVRDLLGGIGDWSADRFWVRIGDDDVGVNPKINNLVVAEASAKHSLILVSDASVRPRSSYLKEAVERYHHDSVGVVSGTVIGYGGEGIGGALDEIHFSTYYPRWTSLAAILGYGNVMGMTMLYNRNTAKHFGGLRALADYVAEDYMLGQKAKGIGLKVSLINAPVEIYIGKKGVGDFANRTYRWGVMRKMGAPVVFLFEPVSYSAVVAAAYYAMSPGDFFTALSVLVLFYGFDCMMLPLEQGIVNPVAWLLREILLPFIWLRALLVSTIEWRGTRIRVLPRGVGRRLE